MSAEIQNTEHCGVIATVGLDIESQNFGEGWWRIRNRGDGAWGMLTISDSGIQSDHVQKSDENSYPIDALANANVQAFLRLGHNRYATSGKNSPENAQPFLLFHDEYMLGLAHNGNIPTEVVDQLRALLIEPMEDDASDSRVVAQLLLESRPHYVSWQETFIQVLPKLQGAFSLACITEENVIYAMRDPWGIRPLCLGKKDNTWVVVSESVALETMGVDFVREVLPGELVCLHPDGTSTSVQYAQTDEGEFFCVLELIYFAKIDSLIKMKKVRDERQSLGRAVGTRFVAKNIPVDYVIPILNSGKQMSVGVSQTLQMPNTEAISLSTDERSFIQNTPTTRTEVVNKKHVIDGKFVEGKRILLCDDSIVRGTSLSALLENIKKHSPAEIHIVIGSEPVIDTCDLGVDLPTNQELLVYRLIQDRPDWEDDDAYLLWLTKVEHLVADRLGVSSVTYLDRKSVNIALERQEEELCRHCFGGTHPIRDHKRPIYLADTAMVSSVMFDTT